ncbi:hypothetical protein A7U60_g2134 [Sanghuangporus baumii]|uniref:Fungal-type protein kinase domain-containing protein n=1 Tax=Sanghuangporus baumii TaxID=108892 RepID=A0A9Q5NB50_SANBA|nr:hypothetical protein A7U60_g2134 [Sanghuangporus baumii]
MTAPLVHAFLHFPSSTLSYCASFLLISMHPIVEKALAEKKPRVRRATQSPVASVSDPNHKVDRFSILEELRDPGYAIPEITTSSFSGHLLPPLRDGINVKDVVASLKREGLIDSEEGQMWLKTGTRSATGGGNTFAPLVEIFDKAISAVSATTPHLEQVIEMILLPNRHRRSDRRIRLPSACFVLKSSRERTSARKKNAPLSLSWSDFALTMELKKSSSDASCKSNASRVIHSIQRNMAHDPCRRFSFGITVENTSMRLWFCSRATPVVSEEFDFTRNPNLLIHVFLSLAFASKEDLGWDPTVRPYIRGDGERVYHIDVDGEIYETDRILASSSAEELVGHATRVWMVRHLHSGESYVLKDVWVEDGRDLEHIIYEDILHDVETKYSVDARKEVASHLLTPTAHWLVHVNGVEDHTTTVMMREYLPSFRRKFRVEITGPNEISKSESESCSSYDIEIQDSIRDDLRMPLPWCNPVRKVIGRRHYRVLFKEIATAIYTLRNLGEVFTVLGDSTKALSRIHGCGWVHRDISIGNLYMYRGRGLIGDLEYAKCKNSDVAHELRTGTPDFVAVEAAGRIYTYLPEEDDDELEAELRAMVEGRMADIRLKETTERSTPFFHNDLHDLESLWWIAVWVLFSSCPVSDDGTVNAEDSERDEQREAASSMLFPSVELRRERRLFLQSKDAFYTRTAWMPDRFRSIKVVLNTLRRSIVRKYSKFEADYPDFRDDALGEAHDEFLKHLGRCKELASGVMLTPYISITRRLRLRNVEGLGKSQASTVLPTVVAKHVVECELYGTSPTSPSPDGVSIGHHNQPLKGDGCTSTECFVRTGKRKRDDNDDGGIPSIRPFRMPRHELQVY